VFDMNDDITGMAGMLTLHLCERWITEKEPNIDDTLALIRWGLRQPAAIGLFLAKSATVQLFTKLPEDARVAAITRPEFRHMCDRYGDIFTGGGNATLRHYEMLKDKENLHEVVATNNGCQQQVCWCHDPTYNRVGFCSSCGCEGEEK